MDLFENLKRINKLINNQEESQAREELIKVLANVEKPDSSLLNHLLREVGLYPIPATLSVVDKINILDNKRLIPPSKMCLRRK